MKFITRKIIPVLLLFVVSVQSQVATKTISGKVSDENNNPISGVTIKSDGTTSSVFTDFDGTFKISL